MTDGVRTHDNRDHNPGLYQLSYGHHALTFNILVLMILKTMCYCRCMEDNSVHNMVLKALIPPERLEKFNQGVDELVRRNQRAERLQRLQEYGAKHSKDKK